MRAGGNPAARMGRYPRRRGRNRMAGDRILQPVEPRLVRPPARQKPAALRLGVVMGRQLACMGRLQRIDQPIQKPPPPGGRLLEQPIHLWREPDNRHQRRHLGLAARRRPVDPKRPPLAPRRVAPGADLESALRREQPRRHTPACSARSIDTPGKVSDASTTQPSSRHEQRYGFEQVGLAAAIEAGQHCDASDLAGVEIEAQRAVAAKIPQPQPCQPEHGGADLSGYQENDCGQEVTSSQARCRRVSDAFSRKNSLGEYERARTASTH
jgi:hypothetical protein